tara:strand:- start:2945 stop:3694 length:750 start_codon:yes stop_codon:yes gene_type:complete
MSNYNDEYFNDFYEMSYKSAIEILKPILVLKSFKNIADIGCGAGAWLQACYDLSEDKENLKLTGVDGAYMKDQKKFNKVNYIYKNLEKETLNGKFDFLISVEVAEHLNESSADFFIDSLCSLSDIILFSAAQIGQGGRNHLNEKSIGYWKNKFVLHGYRPYTFFKNKIWNKPIFDNFPYYISNSILYVKNHDDIFKKNTVNYLSNFTHPNFLKMRSKENISFKEHLAFIFPSLIKGINKKINILFKNKS